ncbi:unnamed protein product [Linum tenue]|uniref:RRM domain-containing protein n=1 Tax=Linum tenue TaxID=586396 RepID=A0AAV0PGJ2_9ROSI|nr:unnamed protein product [Linum tenue]
MATIRFGASLTPPPLTGNTVAAPARSPPVHFPTSSSRIFLQFHCSNPSPRCHSPTLDALISPFSVRPQTTGRSRAVFNEGSVLTEESSSGGFSGNGSRKEVRPCELYVCNLPRSCDIPQLAEIFKPYGTVVSVEVSKNPETGVSRGCGYVTMGSQSSARKAMHSLDGYDVEGREMRVRFSVDMTSGRRIERNEEVMTTASPSRTLIYESPYKLYVGNLAWTIRPDALRKKFSEFGNVVSARVLYDRKGGKNRAYGFISFSTSEEREASLCLDSTDFHGRVLVVRKGVDRQDL